MALGWIYGVCFLVGLTYAVLSSVFGWLFDHGDVDLGHVDAGGHFDAGQPSPLSATVLATFVTGFGAGGTIAHFLLGWSLLPGLGLALGSGVALAGVSFAALEFLFSRTQAGSEYVAEEMGGRIGEVITSIPAEGMGEISYLVKGQRERAGARAVDGVALPKGCLVTIEHVSGATAFVRRKASN